MGVLLPVSLQPAFGAETPVACTQDQLDFINSGLNKSALYDCYATQPSGLNSNYGLYGIPVFTGVECLAYNTDILTQSNCWRADDGSLTSVNTGNLFIPTTWSELYEASEWVYDNYPGNAGKTPANKAVGGFLPALSADGSSAFPTLTFMRSAGGDFVDSSNENGVINDSLVLNSPQNQDVFQYLRMLAATGLPSFATINDDPSTVLAFRGNKAAFMISSNGFATDNGAIDDQAQQIDPSAPRQYDQIRVAEFPACDLLGQTLTGVDGSTYTFNNVQPVDTNVSVGNCIFSLTKKNAGNSERQQMCVDFIMMLLEEQQQMNFYLCDGRLPVVNDDLSKFINIDSATDDVDAQYVAQIQKQNALNQAGITTLLNNGSNMKGGIPNFTNKPADVWAKWTNFVINVAAVPANGAYTPISTLLANVQTDIANLSNIPIKQ